MYVGGDESLYARIIITGYDTASRARLLMREVQTRVEQLTVVKVG